MADFETKKDHKTKNTEEPLLTGHVFSRDNEEVLTFEALVQFNSSFGDLDIDEYVTYMFDKITIKENDLFENCQSFVFTLVTKLKRV